MEHLLDLLRETSGIYTYLLVFLVLLGCGLGVPIPEDIILFCGGLASYYGNANVFTMIGVAFVGVLAGDSIIFYLGNRYGPSLLKKGIFRRLLHAERLGSIKKRIHKRGNGIIFLARFMPGLRAPIYFSCGSLHLPTKIFLLYDGLAALISVPAIVYATYFFGHEIDKVIQTVRRIENGIAILILVGILLLLLKWFLNRRSSQSA